MIITQRFEQLKQSAGRMATEVLKVKEIPSGIRGCSKFQRRLHQ